MSDTTILVDYPSHAQPRIPSLRIEYAAEVEHAAYFVDGNQVPRETYLDVVSTVAAGRREAK